MPSITAAAMPFKKPDIGYAKIPKAVSSFQFF
jgi:hypothetical protein